MSELSRCSHTFEPHGCSDLRCILPAGHKGHHKCAGDRERLVSSPHPADELDRLAAEIEEQRRLRDHFGDKASEYYAEVERLTAELAVCRETLAVTQDALDAKNQVDRTDAEILVEAAPGGGATGSASVVREG